MPTLSQQYYRRNYSGESITHVEDSELKSVFVTPREFPYDFNARTAIVLGNGIGRTTPEVQLLLRQNNGRVAEGYKLTYACNAAHRDTAADYYILKNNIFFADIPLTNYNKMFVPNDMWFGYRDANLLPYVYHMDAGASAAYLACFDGAKKVFLFGFDGTDGVTSDNIYANTMGYDSPETIEDFNKFNMNLYMVMFRYSDTEFYRVRNQHSHDFYSSLKNLPNYHEVTVRDAVILGDF